MGWRTRQCRNDNTASTAGCRPLAPYSGAQLRSRRNEQNPTGEDLQNHNNNKPAGLRSPDRPPSRSSSSRIRSVDVHFGYNNATYTVSTAGLGPPERQGLHTGGCSRPALSEYDEASPVGNRGSARNNAIYTVSTAGLGPPERQAPHHSGAQLHSRRNEQNPTGEDLQNNNNNKPAGLRSPDRPPSRSSSSRIRSVDVHCSDATYTVSTAGLRPPERRARPARNRCSARSAREHGKARPAGNRCSARSAREHGRARPAGA